MSYLKTRSLIATVALTFTSPLIAGDDPLHERHELMEGVGDAAKPIGQMLKGEQDFDAAVVMTSLKTFDEAAAQFGELFPPGSETGEGTEAAPAIWEDRAGFDKALATWSDAVDAAIAANPQTVEETKTVAGPVFNACKGCHDDYRIEDE
ncbi:MAG: cytochrome c [Gammaproteobacteria bacterium]|jgi:cytochrome c556|nr:cytochrome c [Gammaproteobacteria bacterium]MDH3848314.1 cytochrome c [Gammaproteobacteria bacterium]MDH3864759.1 cytochrome c [Gammaproteobacteria bacterium]MDH3906321.1 cytochrome c [Gammaproteobacteria bacterium]MDH3908623.1 cytochrome c [Gammaproteobacteria bacterium]